MDTSLRYIATLKALPRYPLAVTVQELHDLLWEQGFEVELRTIQRDLNKLANLFQIGCDDTCKPYRWYFQAEAPVESLPALDASAALGLLMATQQLEQNTPSSVSKTFTPYVQAAHKVFNPVAPTASVSVRPAMTPPAHLRHFVRTLPAHFQLQSAFVDANVWRDIAQALLQRRQCRILYQSRESDTVREYYINPLALVLKGSALYLLATFKGYEDVRQLALHRCQQVQVLSTRAQVPLDFDLDIFLYSQQLGNQKVASHSNRMRVHLRCLRPAMQHLLETPIAGDQMLLLSTKDYFEITASLADSAEFRAWLLAQGEYVQVLGPSELREQIQARLQAALAQYHNAWDEALA